MVGESAQRCRVVEEVGVLYDWIDTQLRQNRDRTGRCRACGACCDFHDYDHRLFVASPELIHLAAKLKVERLHPMPSGRCPYQQNRRCSIHKHRFAGCRIFCCSGDMGFQSELSEAALRRLKAICETSRVSYRYQDLAAALAACNTAEGGCATR